MSSKRDNIDLIVSASELTSVFDRKSSLSNLLQDIVEMVAMHMAADVCSIYLYSEQHQELVLSATVGLAASSIGRVKLKPGEGITGIALKELRPIREARATKNPGFKYFSDINEEKYEAFLAVPIKKGLNRIGVITLQHGEPSYFTERDAAALKAIASQLAASIENSQMLMNLHGKTDPDEDPDDLKIEGSATGSTAVSGSAFILGGRTNRADGLNADLYRKDSVENALALFDRALELSMNQLDEIQSNIDDSLTDVAGMIFTAHFLMLRDDHFSGEMKRRIGAGRSPLDAVHDVTAHYVDIFKASELPGIREKVQDVKDLEHRLLANLSGEVFDAADYSSHLVIADDIFPSELVKIWLQKAKALVLYGSGLTAHISILARSLGLPLFMTGDKRILRIKQGSELLLDSESDLLYVNPSNDIMSSFKTAVGIASGDICDIPGPVTTADGTPVKVLANINIIHDIDAANSVRADGIGLYRSEFPFIVRNELPSEEEQFRIYRTIMDKNAGAECVFRTLDIGGDKMPGYAAYNTEANPFLGYRGIRFSLGNPDVFIEQLRAVLRAGKGFELKIMFPMISSPDEFLQAKQYVVQCIAALKSEGAVINDKPKIGTMIELPAAVSVIDRLSAEADFLSIGTNDLVMYTLGVDRTNERVRDLYKPWHPAVLSALKKIASQALLDKTELSVCGEAAADEAMLRFMLGVGIRRFSADPLRIPEIKNTVTKYNLGECEEFASRALSAGSVGDNDSLFCKKRTDHTGA